MPIKQTAAGASNRPDDVFRRDCEGVPVRVGSLRGYMLVLRVGVTACAFSKFSRARAIARFPGSKGEDGLKVCGPFVGRYSCFRDCVIVEARACRASSVALLVSSLHLEFQEATALEVCCDARKMRRGRQLRQGDSRAGLDGKLAGLITMCHSNRLDVD